MLNNRFESLILASREGTFLGFSTGGSPAGVVARFDTTTPTTIINRRPQPPCTTGSLHHDVGEFRTTGDPQVWQKSALGRTAWLQTRHCGCPFISSTFHHALNSRRNAYLGASRPAAMYHWCTFAGTSGSNYSFQPFLNSSNHWYCGSVLDS